jgi:hypothetical protein
MALSRNVKGSRHTAQGARKAIRRKIWILFLGLEPCALSLAPIGKWQPAYNNIESKRIDSGINPNDYFASSVRSHMGKKIARAKKPTTAASPTVSSGPIASDSFFIEYSTSVS